MKPKLQLCISILFFSVSLAFGQWAQLGGDIDGEAAGDQFGRSVSLNSDGSIIAIGARHNDGSGVDSGHVRVYQFDGTNWNQLGQDIDGEAADDRSGISVSLSGNGSIIAIGAHWNDGNGADSGHVRVYQFDGMNWNQLGQDIDGEMVSNYSGVSVNLNGDGNIVAIGAPYNDGNGLDSGHVRVYQFNGINWNQLGQDIDGEAAGDRLGWSVSLSSDGGIVAVGAPYNDGNGVDSGHIRVYQFDGLNWAQQGGDIDGEAAGDNSGASVSLSSDGTIVAIGALYNDENGTDSGHVRIYQFDGMNWMQQGGDIDGEAAGDNSGVSVSLSSNGTTVAIGAVYNSGNGNYSGHVRIHQFDGLAWNQVGSDIDGEAANNGSGLSVSLSNDGNIVAIGAIANDGNGVDSGHVRIYEFNQANPSDMSVDGVAAGDEMGYAVSVSGNGSVAAFGARNNDENGAQSGHVRIFEISGIGLTQLGGNIPGEAPGDRSGVSVSLNGDGSRVAIGARFNSGITGTSSGHVRIYEFDGLSWNQVGGDIDGEAAYDYSGVSVSLNGSGDIVAIGAYGNDENGSMSGHVRVYQYDGVSSWVQLGSDINGEAFTDLFGISVSISNDGNRMAAGASNNNGTGPGDSGHARVYEFNGADWIQLGGDIDGETAYDHAGSSVSLSGDGNSIAVGEPGYDAGGLSNSGRVRIYEYDNVAWNLVADIGGEAAEDASGGAVSLNDDGTVVAIGAAGNDGNGGIDSGHVQVYRYDGVSWIQQDADIDGEAPEDRFGCSVSLSDNGNTMAVGAYWNDSNGDASGRAYVFQFNTPGPAYTQIPDPNFEQALIDQGIDSEGILDGQVLTNDISDVISLNVSGKNIADLTGIEDFTALEILQCQVNQLTDLDVTQNLNLIDLDCHDNQLAALDVTQNINLTQLRCEYNQLTALDVTQNPSLTVLRCYNNLLTDLVIANPNLTGLYCYNNPLVSLDVSQSPNLTYLHCYSSQLVVLDVTQNPNLTDLYCHNNQLTALDITQNPGLTALWCSSNQLVALDITQNPNLKYLWCDNNQLTGSLLLNGLNLLTIFDATGNPDLVCIQVDNEADANAGVGIYAGWTKDPAVVYSEDCVTLLYTQIPDSNFEQALIDQGIDSEGILDGQVLTADISGITTLDVSGESIADLTGIENFAALETLHCFNNQLTTLNVTQNTNLTELLCYTNQLAALDVTQNTGLTILNCYNNLLAALDVSQNTGLTDLHCGTNQLSGLDVTQNTGLIYLYCNGNQLATLDVTQNINLNQLYCNNNQLTGSLLLNGLTSLNDFSAANNPGLECIQVDNETDANAGGGIYTSWNKDPGTIYSENCAGGLYTQIPDLNFEQVLIDQGIDSEGILDGQVLTADISGIISLNVASLGIADLTGIEDFTALQDLACNDNDLISLDVGNNINLITLNCDSNDKLTGLNVNGAINLMTLNCSSNKKLTTVDVSANTNLTDLICNNNDNLNDLNVNGAINLTTLTCSNNKKLATIDVSQNANLTELICFNTKLSGSIDVSGLTNLTTFYSEGSNLDCIQVANAIDAISGAGIYAGWVKDRKTIYSEDCGIVMPKAVDISDIKTTDTDGTPEEENSMAEKLTVYPNPANERLYIVLPEGRELLAVSIYDMQREKVAEAKTTAISTAHLSEGTYFVKIRLSGDEIITKKIIISRK